MRAAHVQQRLRAGVPVTVYILKDADGAVLCDYHLHTRRNGRLGPSPVNVRRIYDAEEVA